MSIPFSTVPLRTVILVLVCCVLVSGAQAGAQRFGWAQETRLTVATPAGPVSARAVHEINATFYAESPPFATITQIEYTVQGGPLMLEIAPDAWIFGIIRNTEFFESAYAELSPRQIFLDTLSSQGEGDPRPVDPALFGALPGLVFFRFADPADPNSAELVDLGDLAALYGPGHTLVGVTTRPTLQAASTGGRLHNILPWLATYDDWITLPRPGARALQIAPFEFVAGVKR
ncbi:hypothetical protein KDD17_04280 [Sulfitobacter albidus]|uniref:Uncharacterized protein n=1 Tax=Sulfitobacter albidus TaxID=2829501 RepID=A0A975JEX2_9RHOB|nr:hypothetical protein [Sulfitobacter albidus]QUJ77242.1 hypothetical protein KDD17_04280 [Sulfitobacter albidus]